MKRNDDRTGMMFGQLTVISRAEDVSYPSGYKDSTWICRCECGTERKVTGHNLDKGNTLGCGGHKNWKKREDLSGKRFGSLVAVSFDVKKNKWNCTCDCGTTRKVRAASLKDGSTKSCGCSRRKPRVVSVAPGAPYFDPAAKNRYKDGGYWVIKLPIEEREAHSCRIDGRMLEHRYVMENKLNRKLLQEETVHHINGIRHDNRPENLELWSSSHPPGQRVSDKVAWAISILELYSPESMSGANLENMV